MGWTDNRSGAFITSAARHAVAHSDDTKARQDERTGLRARARWVAPVVIVALVLVVAGSAAAVVAMKRSDDRAATGAVTSGGAKGATTASGKSPAKDIVGYRVTVKCVHKARYSGSCGTGAAAMQCPRGTCVIGVAGNVVTVQQRDDAQLAEFKVGQPSFTINETYHEDPGCPGYTTRVTGTRHGDGSYAVRLRATYCDTDPNVWTATLTPSTEQFTGPADV